jgi:site-specific DNA-methyltransferase (adenine-specific)
MGTSPYYEEPGIQIFHGDCREILPTLGKFDLLLTDPPYGIGLKTGGRCATNKEYAAIIGDDVEFDPAHLLALNIPSILWGANHYCRSLPHERGWLAWIKVIFDGAFGTRVMNKKQAEMELAWSNCISRPKSFRHLWDGVFRDSESGTQLHAAQKPVALMSWCLSLVPEAKTVIDPYMGSGPVAKACKDRGLKYVGIELVEKYCEIAAKRLAQEVLFA